MIDSVFRLLAAMDSFKKVALFLLTGLTALCIWLGYRVTENYAVWSSWNSIPHVLKTELPCNLVQVRSGVFLVSISFPRPAGLPKTVTAFTSSLWSASQLDSDEFSDLCKDLVTAVNSNEAETILAPYLQQKN